MSNAIEHSGWKVHWRVTESAGVQVYLADYEGRRVMWEGSLPYVLVDHQAPGDELGDEIAEGSFEHGPFWVPLGARTLLEPVRTNEFRGGFEIAADFVAGPFRYTQLWRFHADGRIGPWLTIYGDGLHDGHTYHPHWRFDFDLDGSDSDSLEALEEGVWTPVPEEGWFPASGRGANGGPLWRQRDDATGAQVSIRPHRREDAELYALRYHIGEWPPFTPHGGAGGQPFPAAYVGAEPIAGEDVTLWYVAHVHYDHAFPFTAGPWVQVEGL
jgi:hypothetical protein